MIRVDSAAVIDIIRDTAKAVILPRFHHLAAGDVREKGPGDYVTIADTEAEALLTRRLTDLLPGSLVVGEEAVAADCCVLDRLKEDAPVWIIDPVDGTANFAHGRKKFAVIVALAVGGETVMGWIHDPLNDRTAFGEKGAGAFIGETRLQLRDDVPLAEMHGNCRKTSALSRTIKNIHRNGSAAHDYLDLLEGRCQFAHYLRMKPWDHAAGVLMQLEAGGYAALCDGRAYSPALCEGHLLMAPSKASWDLLRAML
jgi:fructose-1,6-bisphosphatase/inositol monophosphatase family enzyme